MQDFRGVEIEVGSRVVYPVRRGSAIAVRAGRVTAVDDASGMLDIVVEHSSDHRKAEEMRPVVVNAKYATVVGPTPDQQWVKQTVEAYS